MADLEAGTVKFGVNLILQFLEDPEDREELRRIGQRAIADAEFA